MTMTREAKTRLAYTWFAVTIVANVGWWYYYLPDAGRFLLILAACIIGFLSCCYAATIVGEYAHALFRIVHRELTAMRQRS